MVPHWSAMKRLLIAASLTLVAAGSGCGRSSTSPTPGPSPVSNLPGPAPAPPAATAHKLNGYVGDTAFRPMGGVRIEVLNGPDAGKELTSDAQGVFSYVGLFPGSVSVRAAKDGYLTMTSTVFVSVTTDQAWVSFLLAPSAPPVSAQGSYPLTISVDSGCAGFPDAARVRSYPAQLTVRTGATLPPNTQFGGQVTGATFAPYTNIFWVGVAGNYVAVSTEGEGPSIVEQLGPKTYISYFGQAGASVPGGSRTVVSAPFRGSIEYCELKSPVGQYYECTDALAEVRLVCTGADSRLTLAPR
jgi:hypothetical protein